MGLEMYYKPYMRLQRYFILFALNNLKLKVDVTCMSNIHRFKYDTKIFVSHLYVYIYIFFWGGGWYILP